MLRPKVLAMVCLGNVGRLGIAAMTLRTGELSLIEIVLSAHVLKRIDKLIGSCQLAYHQRNSVQS